MAVTYGVRGSVSDASTEQTLYTVPASKNAKIKVSVANRSSSTTYRVAIVSGGGATATDDYILYDETLAANEALTSEVLTLTETDIVRVESGSATVTFMAYGLETDI